MISKITRLQFCCDDFHDGIPEEGLYSYPEIKSVCKNGERKFKLPKINKKFKEGTELIFVNGVMLSPKEYKLENNCLYVHDENRIKKGDCIDLNCIDSRVEEI